MFKLGLRKFKLLSEESENDNFGHMATELLRMRQGITTTYLAPGTPWKSESLSFTKLLESP